jgi:hypothetical protein
MAGVIINTLHIDTLQKVKAESERLLTQLSSSSSRLYEISTTGTIVERTQQLRDFYEFVARHLGEVLHRLSAGGGAAGQ